MNFSAVLYSLAARVIPMVINNCCNLRAGSKRTDFVNCIEMDSFILLLTSDILDQIGLGDSVSQAIRKTQGNGAILTKSIKFAINASCDCRSSPRCTAADLRDKRKSTRK